MWRTIDIILQMLNMIFTKSARITFTNHKGLYLQASSNRTSFKSSFLSDDFIDETKFVLVDTLFIPKWLLKIETTKPYNMIMAFTISDCLIFRSANTALWLFLIVSGVLTSIGLTTTFFAIKVGGIEVWNSIRLFVVWLMIFIFRTKDENTKFDE